MRGGGMKAMQKRLHLEHFLCLRQAVALAYFRPIAPHPLRHTFANDEPHACSTGNTRTDAQPHPFADDGTGR